MIDIWGLIVVACGIIILVAGLVGASTKNLGMMKLVAKRKPDDTDESYIARGKKTALISGIVFVLAGLVFIFV